VVSSCEHSNEPSSSVKGREFFDWLSNYLLLKKDSAPWNWLIIILICFFFLQMTYVLLQFIGFIDHLDIMILSCIVMKRHEHILCFLCIYFWTNIFTST